MGIFDRLSALGGTDVGQALGSAHDHFQERLNTHGHFGRAFIESVAELCRNHPNIVGVAVGVAVEQLLVHEKHHHDLEAAEAERQGRPAGAFASAPRAAPGHTPHHLLRFAKIHPGRIALEVFSALVLLKFTRGIARIFSRHRQSQGSLATVSRIRLFSGTFATYFTCKALKSHEASALRNGLAMFFATRALKPLLRPDFHRPLPEPPAHAAEPEFGLDPEMHHPEPEPRLFH
jgi:hypothetical protein